MSELYKRFIRTNKQRELFDEVEKLSERVKGRAAETDKQGVFLNENLADLKKTDYVSFSLPEALGGKNLSLYEFLLLQEKLAEGDGSVALSVGWHLGILMELQEQQLWSHEDFIKLALEVSKYKKMVNRAATEPATGSPTRGGVPETKAVRREGNYIINGRKSFTTMASQLDYYIVSAYVEDKNDVGWFLINRQTPGITVDHTWDTLGMRGTGSDDIVLKDVKVSEDLLVEMKSKRKSAPKGWLLHIPACYLGIAISARNDAVAFAKEYQPNSLDKPISEVAHVQQKIGEMDLKLLQARHFMYAVAEQWDQASSEERKELGPDLAAVKTTATNVANEVVDLAMRIVGGKGLARTLPFERYYRDVRAGLHNPPMDDMVISMLAKRAIDN